MGEKLLEIKNLAVEYRADETTIYAVNGVNLSLEKGEALGLVGETGAGKTTIAKSIMRILPPAQAHITSGEIIYEGQDLLALKEKEMQKVRGNKIAMIFQDPMTALNPVETVGFQIAESIKQHNRISKNEARDRAGDMLELVGIPRERFTDYPHQFSGGMKQRVVIAMALACNPELLLADEPTTALDVTIQAQVLDMMRDLKAKLGTSVILITHDFGVVADFCSSVAVTYAGEIIERGSVDRIFNNPSHPYTQGLFNSLPSLETTSRRLKPIKGLMPDPSDLPEGCRFCERCDYATERCAQAAPEVTEIEPGHFVKCYRARGDEA
jgi:peptide/nickel transport system ATP-binding protein